MTLRNSKFTRPSHAPRSEKTTLERKDATIRQAYHEIEKLRNEVQFLRKLLASSVQVLPGQKE